MAKDPAFLFYPSDFMMGVSLLNFEQRGKYITLLCLQHQQGHLSRKDMETICNGHDKKVFAKFIRDEEGFYFNDRLEIEVDKRAKHCQKQRENVMKRWSKSTENTTSIPTYGNTMVLPLENVNENINTTTKNSLNKGVARGKQEPLSDLDKSILDYQEYRNKIKKPLTEKALTLFKTKLDKMASTDTERIEIINQSIVNGWTGIFPLKDEKQPKKNNAESLKYIQRNYTEEDLSHIYANFRGPVPCVDLTEELEDEE